jgi:phage baseplate assembly protein W
LVDPREEASRSLQSILKLPVDIYRSIEIAHEAELAARTFEPRIRVLARAL